MLDSWVVFEFCVSPVDFANVNWQPLVYKLYSNLLCLYNHHVLRVAGRFDSPSSQQSDPRRWLRCSHAPLTVFEKRNSRLGTRYEAEEFPRPHSVLCILGTRYVNTHLEHELTITAMGPFLHVVVECCVPQCPSQSSSQYSLLSEWVLCAYITGSWSLSLTHQIEQSGLLPSGPYKDIFLTTINGAVNCVLALLSLGWWLCHSSHVSLVFFFFFLSFFLSFFFFFLFWWKGDDEPIIQYPTSMAEFSINP